MRFNYIEKDKLPPLAWLVRIKKNNKLIEVFHGKMVECKHNFFVAGVWNGDFNKGDFVNASFSCCTGGIISGDGNEKRITFSTPNHLKDALFSIMESDTLLISNSPAFLLSFSKNNFDINYYNYEIDFNSLCFGVRRYIKKTVLRNGKTMRIHRCCNLHVNPYLSCKEEIRYSKPLIETYSYYLNFINTTLSEIKKNANDKERMINYKFVATISKGYDATCASVLALKNGCDTVLTFNSPERYKEDSGEDIAKLLGFKKIICGNGSDYLNNSDLWEAESASNGDVGSLVAFNTFENYYKNSILVMGLEGDCIWNIHEEGNNELDLLHLSLSANYNPEHYLRTNTIQLNVPLIGGDNWPSISVISNSQEMKPFSVGGNYDRPIPRRVVEEAGIPRNLFGVSKRGAGFSMHFDTLKRAKKKMSKVSYSSLMEFRKSIKRNKYLLIKKWIIFIYNMLPVYINYLFSKFHINFAVKTKQNYMSSPFASLLILWGMDVMIKKYNNALK